MPSAAEKIVKRWQNQLFFRLSLSPLSSKHIRAFAPGSKLFSKTNSTLNKLLKTQSNRESIKDLMVEFEELKIKVGNSVVDMLCFKKNNLSSFCAYFNNPHHLKTFYTAWLVRSSYICWFFISTFFFFSRFFGTSQNMDTADVSWFKWHDCFTSTQKVGENSVLPKKRRGLFSFELKWNKHPLLEKRENTEIRVGHHVYELHKGSAGNLTYLEMVATIQL